MRYFLEIDIYFYAYVIHRTYQLSSVGIHLLLGTVALHYLSFLINLTSRLGDLLTYHFYSNLFLKH
mgnify:CR=1 FL=1